MTIAKPNTNWVHVAVKNQITVTALEWMISENGDVDKVK